MHQQTDHYLTTAPGSTRTSISNLPSFDLPSRNRPLNILVVGGGIAGLSAALMLERSGHQTEIIEQSDRWQSFGGGITLMCNGMTLLDRLGLGDPVRSGGRIIQSIRIADARDQTLSRFNVHQYAGTLAPTVTIHRHDLHVALRARLRFSNVRFAMTVRSLERLGDQMRAVFSDGTSRCYDLVVGSDGLHSSVREFVSPSRVRYAGYVCWRFICSGDGLPFERDGLVEMWGVGKRFGIVPLSQDRIHCFAAVNAGRPETLRSTAVGDFRLLFREFGGMVPQLLERLPGPGQLWFAPIEEVKVTGWVRDRVVLIGDAAHGMTPNLTQGASLAIEDAECLSRVIDAAGCLDEGLRAYREERWKRVGAIRRRSALLGRVGQWQSPVLAGLRNFCWKKMPDRWLQKDFENILIPGYEQRR